MSFESSSSPDAERAQISSGRIKRFTETLHRLIPTREEARKSRALRWLGPLLDREWLWHLNRRTVATGAALGVFFGLHRFRWPANAIRRSRRDPARASLSGRGPGHFGLQSLHRRTDILAGASCRIGRIDATNPARRRPRSQTGPEA